MRGLIAIASLYGYPPHETREWAIRDLEIVAAAHEVMCERNPLWGT